MKVFVQGLKNGLHNLKALCLIDETWDIFPEFFGIAEIQGTLTVEDDKFVVFGTSTCKVRLICDCCAAEFVEDVCAPVSCRFLFGEMSSQQLIDDDVYGVPFDAKELDLSAVLREELILALPLKRLSPNCVSQDSLTEQLRQQPSHEQQVANEDEIQPIWSVLKDVKTDN